MNENNIISVRARQILDSRGNPTIESTVMLNCGISGSAAVPSGASVGSHEAFELRDGNPSCFCGKSVLNAVGNVNEIICHELCGKSVLKQRLIDGIMCSLDGSENKSNLGANAILSVSLACAKAGAAFLGIPLYEYIGGISSCIMPTPMMNILNGGKHSDNGLAFQEFMILPVGFSTFSDALQAGVEVFKALKKLLKEKNLSTSVGDEGGFAPEISNNIEALDILAEAINLSGYGTDNIKIALDCAASEFYRDGDYYFEDKHRDSAELTDYFISLTDKYPIVSIEDAMAEDDYVGWKLLSSSLCGRCLIVGDDLFVTDKKRVEKGIKDQIANAILIKPNQCGTLTETLDTVRTAQSHGYKTIISHRSGDTEDTFIADLSVGVNSGFIKTGSLSRSERTSKYNRLLKIEEDFNNKAVYPGLHSFF